MSMNGTPGGVSMVVSVMGLLRWVHVRLQLAQEGVEPCVALLPVLAISHEPFGRAAQRFGLEMAEPSSRPSRTRDQAGRLEDLQMLRDGRLAQGERLRQLPHR